MMYTARDGKSVTKSHGNKAELKATESKSLQGTKTLSFVFYFFIYSGGRTHMSASICMYMQTRG